MKPLALTWRVSLLVTLVLAAVIAVISVVAYLELRQALRESFDEGLLVVAKGISGEMDEPHGGEDLRAEIRRFVRPSAHLRSVEYRVWEDGQAEDLAASPDAESRQEIEAIPQAKRPGPGSTRFLSTGGRDGARRMVWMRRATRRGTANVVVSASEGYVRHEMSEFLGILVGIGGVMGLGAAAITMLIVVWGLRPIGQTAAVLSGITHRTLGHEPLDALRAPRELRPFISTLSEMLARLNRGILQQQQFIADASHELRTPLALAKSTLQAVRSRDRQTLEYRRAVDETLDDLGRMERLINQLLVLTRMDETEGLADVADVPLDALLVQLAAKFDVRARAGGGRVVADSLPAVFVRGNEDLLARLFGNLLDNAITHGPDGGTVRVSLEPQDGTLCEVSIHDAGGRIPPETLPRLFDRFYRADPSRARTTGGAGLGLAIAREIARRHGGDIKITSTPAVGTRVLVRLPWG